ncbi:MAG TPA: HEAT repeat domain-containing protein [Blastocatellia bacterium]|nr:HEAT repeat domain-containing protein [Blastocatellia bacterium]
MLLILVIIIVVALVYAFSSQRGLNLNERLYLKRRGYEPPIDIPEGRPIPKDARLFSLIESLSDISPYARQKAAEDLSRMCASGQGDSRMLNPLIDTLDDRDASVRGAVATALGKLGDPASIEPLTRRMEVEDSIMVRASLTQALEKLAG